MSLSLSGVRPDTITFNALLSCCKQEAKKNPQVLWLFCSCLAVILRLPGDFLRLPCGCLVGCLVVVLWLSCVLVCGLVWSGLIWSSLVWSGMLALRHRNRLNSEPNWSNRLNSEPNGSNRLNSEPNGSNRLNSERKGLNRLNSELNGSNRLNFRTKLVKPLEFRTKRVKPLEFQNLTRRTA